MANEHEDKAKKQAEEQKKAAQGAREAEQKKPAPTQDELNDTLEGMVKEAEAAGRRDEPAIARARDLLDRRENKKGKGS